ncbi:MAG: hypothetical protein WD772_04875 [Pseudohongiellaceae bacterium]
MEKENRSTKPSLIGLLFLAVVALVMATNTMSHVGLSENYVYILTLSFLLCLLLSNTNQITVLLVVAGLVVANLPDPYLQELGVDTDVVLALVAAFILAPNISHLLSN